MIGDSAPLASTSFALLCAFATDRQRLHIFIDNPVAAFPIFVLGSWDAFEGLIETETVPYAVLDGTQLCHVSEVRPIALYVGVNFAKCQALIGRGENDES